MEWDEEITAAVVEMLPDRPRVLDARCGYGRISLPLARAGYEIEGLDLSPNLIETARVAAAADGLDVGFTLGSMTSMPYASELEEDGQVRTVGESGACCGLVACIGLPGASSRGS